MQTYSSDLNLLINLLSNASPRETAEQLCLCLMSDFGSLERILCAHLDNLRASIEGSKEFKNKIVFLIECAKALVKRCYSNVLSVGRAYLEEAIIKHLIGVFLFDANESVRMLSFDHVDRFLGEDIIGTGTVNTSNITIRRALELALRRGAHHVIFAHNHPLGTSKPSSEDLSTTHLLARTFATVDIELREHYVISQNSFSKINSETSGVLRCDRIVLTP